MKPGSNMKGRPRGRNQVNKGRGPSRNQTYDSNGPGTRVRGNVHQVVEKYQALARDAAASDDRVLCENYLQHAEHYYRLALAMNAQNPQNPQQRPGNRLDQNQALTNDGSEDFYDDGDGDGGSSDGDEHDGGYRDEASEQQRHHAAQDRGHERSERQNGERQNGERQNGERHEGQPGDREGGQQNNRRRRSRTTRARDAAATEADQRVPSTAPAVESQQPAATEPSSAPSEKANGSGAETAAQPEAAVHTLDEEAPKKTVRRRRSTKASTDDAGTEKEAATA